MSDTPARKQFEEAQMKLFGTQPFSFNKKPNGGYEVFMIERDWILWQEAALSRSAEPNSKIIKVALDEHGQKDLTPDEQAECVITQLQLMEKRVDELEHSEFLLEKKLESRSAEPPKGWREGFVNCHVPVPKEAIEENRKREPIGERIRQELTEFLERNGVVGILLDTETHNVNIQIAKLPPESKPVLTYWGSIYIRNEEKFKELESRSAEPTELIAATETLLEWLPTCSEGSSGYIRRKNVEQAVKNLKAGGSLNGSCRQEASRESDTGGESLELESRSPSTPQELFSRAMIVLKALSLSCTTELHPDIVEEIKHICLEYEKSPSSSAPEGTTRAWAEGNKMLGIKD